VRLQQNSSLFPLSCLKRSVSCPPHFDCFGQLPTVQFGYWSDYCLQLTKVVPDGHSSLDGLSWRRCHISAIWEGGSPRLRSAQEGDVQKGGAAIGLDPNVMVHNCMQQHAYKWRVFLLVRCVTHMPNSPCPSPLHQL